MLMKQLFLAVVFVLLMTATAYANAPNISAPIAVVMCFETGDILYERNMEQRWIPASMTKIMTAFITYQEIEAGNLTLNTQVRVSQNAHNFSNNRRIEGSFVPLNNGAYITVDVLLQLLMLPSANGAAVVLAEHISGTEAAFAERMNNTAEELGMYSSFTNSHGAIAHHSNAYSVAILIREFIQQYPDILRITAMPSMRFGGTTYNNTNRLLSTHPFTGADGFKTGTIRASGWGHSTTAVRDGRRVIAVVMNATNNEQRQSQSRVLLQFGFDELARREAAAAARVRVFHRGTIVPLSAPAVVQNRELLLPLGDVFRYLDFDLNWDATYRLVRTTGVNGGRITLFVDRPLVFISGEAITLTSSARIIDDRVYVPLQFVALATGTTGIWDFDTGVVRFN